jgi:hypothetical protein
MVSDSPVGRVKDFSISTRGSKSHEGHVNQKAPELEGRVYGVMTTYDWFLS